MRILVLVDHRGGAPEPVTYQLIAQARSLAANGGGPVAALVLSGPRQAIETELDGRGLDRIHRVAHDLLDGPSPEAMARVATEAVRRLDPDLFLCGHTFAGMGIAPWVAAAIDAPLLPNCLHLEIDGDALIAERLVHGQAWQTRQRLPLRGTIVVSMARSGGTSDVEAAPDGTPVETLDIDLTALGILTTVTGTIEPEAGEVDISRAEVVVGIGRGLRDRSRLGVMEALAAALGGVVACSRPLVDLEWMPYERQVGASGKSIRPRVYLACGISGAAQHLAGIADAETIIAINRDRAAPIFRVSHYGVVGDLLEIASELTAAIQRRKA